MAAIHHHELIVCVFGPPVKSIFTGSIAQSILL